MSETKRPILFSAILITVLVGIISIGIITYVNAAKQPAINNGITNAIAYLNNSDGNVWNATDITAVKYLTITHPISTGTVAQNVYAKMVFEKELYPFTASLLGGTLVPPSAFENQFDNPPILYRILTCSPFNVNELTAISQKRNTIETPYAGSHAGAQLRFISATYTNCGQPSTATTATNLLSSIVANGLTMPLVNQWYYDAYLEQECIKGLITGDTNMSLIDQLLLDQDQNTSEPLTFGGWYQYQHRLNEPYTVFDRNGNNVQLYYPELPNGHTTVFALCNLLVAGGKT